MNYRIGELLPEISSYPYLSNLELLTLILEL
jgi:hypothetical protein